MQKKRDGPSKGKDSALAVGILHPLPHCLPGVGAEEWPAFFFGAKPLRHRGLPVVELNGAAGSSRQVTVGVVGTLILITNVVWRHGISLLEDDSAIIPHPVLFRQMGLRTGCINGKEKKPRKPLIHMGLRVR